MVGPFLGNAGTYKTGTCSLLVARRLLSANKRETIFIIGKHRLDFLISLLQL